jgi:hypothetical protein
MTHRHQIHILAVCSLAHNFVDYFSHRDPVYLTYEIGELTESINNILWQLLELTSAALLAGKGT